MNLSGVGTPVSDTCTSGGRLEDSSLGTMAFKSVLVYDLDSNKIKLKERRQGADTDPPGNSAQVMTCSKAPRQSL